MGFTACSGLYRMYRERTQHVYMYVSQNDCDILGKEDAHKLLRCSIYIPWVPKFPLL